jgi:bacterioferritin
MQQSPVPTDVAAMRIHARVRIDEGAVTSGYTADRSAVLQLLKDSLATELVCVLRYRRHHFMARGIHSQSVAQEFLVHSNEEQGHADLLVAFPS